MIVSEIKIERLQPEKSRTMFEQIQKMKKTEPSFLTFRFLFAISSRFLMSAKKQKQILKLIVIISFMLYTVEDNGG